MNRSRLQKALEAGAAVVLVALLACCSGDMASGMTEQAQGVSGDAPHRMTTTYEVGELPPLPLSTRGRYVVDAAGNRFKLASANWYGAYDIYNVVDGLHKASLQDIADAIASMGFNSIRLPFSNEMLHVAEPATKRIDFDLNPELAGLTPIEIFDKTIEALGNAGMVVILNNHTTYSEWGVGLDNEGLWYNKMFTKQDWINDWLLLTERYQDNPVVVGMDLRNEIRVALVGGLPAIPNWGAEPNDWRKVAEEAGRAIHRINPDVLIVVEGVNYPRYHMKPVAGAPIRLDVPHKLMYAAHNYAYIGPGWDLGTLTNAVGLDLGDFPKYEDYSWEEYTEIMDEEIGYILDGTHDYSAPVWLSEFGAAEDNQWFKNIIRYMAEKDMDFAYWPVTGGVRPNGYFEYYGLLEPDFVTPIDNNRLALLQSIMQPDRGPGISPTGSPVLQSVEWPAISFDIHSFLYADDGDWFPNVYKASSPSPMRLVGMSLTNDPIQWIAGSAVQGRDVLATAKGRTMDPIANYVIDKNKEDSNGYQNHAHTLYDWKPGRAKLECGYSNYVAGIAQGGGVNHDVYGVLCKKNRTSLGSSCSTRTFVNGNNRGSQSGGDWSTGAYKGQCRDSEYIAGVALNNGSLDSILCCRLDADDNEATTSSGAVIVARHSGKVIDLNKGNGNVLQWQNHSGINQLWAFEQIGANRYIIRSKAGGGVLSAAGNWAGANVTATSYSGLPEQQWELHRTGSHYFIASKLDSELVLDVNNVSNANGANLSLWHNNGGSNQQFRIDPQF